MPITRQAPIAVFDDTQSRYSSNDELIDSIRKSIAGTLLYGEKDYPIIHKLYEINKKRAAHLLTIAAANDVDALVSGAFGCGAFENDPEVVAKAYAAVLEEYCQYFDEIRFAVYCTPRNMLNYEVFKSVLE